jgi:hypothetical protein
MISGIGGISSYDYLQQLTQYESQSGMSCEDVFNKIDANGDGSVSKDEFGAFQSTLEAQGTGAAPQSQGSGIQSLIAQAISAYLKLNPLSPLLSGLGSVTSTG